MNAATLFALAAMLQGTPSAPQSPDSSLRSDTVGGPGTRTILSRSLLLRLPIDDPREALTLVPGVVRRGTAFGIGAGGGLRVRGGAPDAAGVYVDGAPVRNLMTGAQGLTLAADAVDVIAVTRGPGGVEIADAAGGGVLEYVTRAGGSQLDGHIVAASDAPFGDAASAGFNRFGASAGGPAGQHVSWFLSGEVTGQRSAYRGRGAAQQPAFVWGGADTVVNGVTVPTFIETTGLKRPLDWATERRGQGKVSLRVGRGTLAVTGLISEMQQRFFPGADVGDTALFSGARTTSRLVVANWTGALGSGALAPVLHAVISLGHDGASTGLLTPASQTSSAFPALGIEWSSLAFVGSESIPGTTDQIVRNVRSNAGLRTPFLGQTNLRNLQPYRLNPYGLASGWLTQGSDGPLATASENRLDARAWIDWAFAARHQVRAGLDYSRASDAFYRGDLISQVDLDAWTAHPKRVGIFASDRITWDKLAVDVGARFDDFDPGGSVPLVPGRIFSNPAWGPASGVDDSSYSGSLARVYRAATRKNALSPRLRATYLVTSGTVVRFAIGRQVEPASSSQIFGGSNADLVYTFASAPFGGDVNYISTTTADLGFRHSLGVVVLDVDGYLTHRAVYLHLNKPFDDPANPGSTLNLAVPTAVDSIGAGGIEGAIDWVPNASVNGRLVYTFERSQGATTQALGALGMVTTPATLGSALRGISTVVMVRAESGIPYISSVNVGNGDVVRDDFDPVVFLFGSRPNARLPWTTTVDLRLRKQIHLSRLTASAYADIRNALNFRNAVGAFTETGGVTNPLFQANVLNPEFANLHLEASQNGALLSGNAVDLRPDCSTWTGTTAGPVDCAALRQVERRFGNGDGIYDLNEQTAAFNAYYEAFFGSAQFYAPGRTARVGIELTF